MEEAMKAAQEKHAEEKRALTDAVAAATADAKRSKKALAALVKEKEAVEARSAAALRAWEAHTREQLEGLEEMRTMRDALVVERERGEEGVARAAAAAEQARRWARAHAALEAEFAAFVEDRRASEEARAGEVGAWAGRCEELEGEVVRLKEKVLVAEGEVGVLRAAVERGEEEVRGLREQRDAAEAARRMGEVAHGKEATAVSKGCGGGDGGWGYMHVCMNACHDS